MILLWRSLCRAVSSWAHVVADHSRDRQARPTFTRPRLGSKRKLDEVADKSDVSQQNNQNNKRPPPRKVNYGKSNISVAGAEAAPIDIFIGNTNPLATPAMIETVLKKSADQVSANCALNVIEVK